MVTSLPASTQRLAMSNVRVAIPSGGSAWWFRTQIRNSRGPACIRVYCRRRRRSEAETREVGRGRLAFGDPHPVRPEVDQPVAGQVSAGTVRLSVVAPGDLDGVDLGSGLLLPVELLRVGRGSQPGHVEADGEAVDTRASARVDGHDEPTVGRCCRGRDVSPLVVLSLQGGRLQVRRRARHEETNIPPVLAAAGEVDGRGVNKTHLD